MVNDITQEQIDELLQYFSRIKAYEKWMNYRLRGVIDLVWGLLMIAAGILDYIFAMTTGVAPNPIPWVITTIFGVIFMHYMSLKKNLLIEENEKQQNTNFSLKVFIGLLIFTFTGTCLISWVGSAFLIMPWVSLVLVFFFYSVKKDFQIETILPKQYDYGIIVSLILSAIVNLVIYYFFGTPSVLYHGLITGLLFGGSFTLRSYKVKQKIEELITTGAFIQK